MARHTGQPSEVPIGRRAGPCVKFAGQLEQERIACPVESREQPSRPNRLDRHARVALRVTFAYRRVPRVHVPERLDCIGAAHPR
jgi:hypothetical protein